MGLTIIDKLWDAHAITTRADGASLLWVDRHLLHEGSFLAFDQLSARGARVAHPELTFGIADHYVPTRERGSRIADPRVPDMRDQLEANARREKIPLIGLRDPRQGIQRPRFRGPSTLRPRPTCPL